MSACSGCFRRASSCRADYSREPQHASSLGKLGLHAEPQLHLHRHSQPIHKRSAFVAGAESVPAAVLRARTPSSTSRTRSITTRPFRCLNLLRPYPQFDGEFDGLPLFGCELRATTPCSFASRRATANTSPSRAATLFRATQTTVPRAPIAGSDITASGAPQAIDRLQGDTASAATMRPIACRRCFTFTLPVGQGLLDRLTYEPYAGCGDRRLVCSLPHSRSKRGQPISIGMSLPRLADGTQRPD